MKIEALLFDMDGTVIKSLELWDEITASFVGKQNIERFNELRNQSAKKGLARDCEVFQSVFNLKKTDAEIEQMYHQKAREFFAKAPIDFVEGFVDFHQHLVCQNMKISLVTDAPNYGLNVLKDHLNLPFFFGQHIYNSCIMDFTFKPDPKILFHALEKLEVNPENCVIFEDSTEGITAEKKQTYAALQLIMAPMRIKLTRPMLLLTITKI